MTNELCELCGAEHDLCKCGQSFRGGLIEVEKCIKKGKELIKKIPPELLYCDTESMIVKMDFPQLPHPQTGTNTPQQTEKTLFNQLNGAKK